MAAPVREAAICAGVFVLSGLGSAHSQAGFGGRCGCSRPRCGDGAAYLAVATF